MELTASVIQNYSEALYKARSWIRIVGIVSIIQGILTVLSIWGVVICWLPIWMGALLLKASDQIRTAYETDNEDEYLSANEKIAKYFKLSAIFVVVFIGVGLLGVLAAVVVPFFAKMAQ